MGNTKAHWRPKKYPWCILVQKEIKPIIWGAAITPEPWNRQKILFSRIPTLESRGSYETSRQSTNTCSAWTHVNAYFATAVESQWTHVNTYFERTVQPERMWIYILRKLFSLNACEHLLRVSYSVWTCVNTYFAGFDQSEHMWMLAFCELFSLNTWTLTLRALLSI